MGYSTPHSAHEFMKAASLAVIHQYAMAYKDTPKLKLPALLIDRKEIDFNSRLGLFFGPEASISAQGVSTIDLDVSSPKLQVEIKYLRSNGKHPVNRRQDVFKDWNWLISLKNTNGETFRRSAWVVFFPNIEHFAFHDNFQVPKKEIRHFPLSEPLYAPFVKMVEPTSPNSRELQYAKERWDRDILLKKTGTKVVIRRELIGDAEKSPIWCLVYSRVGSVESKRLIHLPSVDF